MELIVPDRLRSARIQRISGLIVLTLMALGVYWPYLHNPLVFDDINLFYSSALTAAAIAPWEGIRGLPYFTLGWVETQIGSMAAHRLASLALHTLVAYQLFRFIEELLIANQPAEEILLHRKDAKTRLIAMMVALAFVCHPVAVYGAGYLVQRTIVFATLFSLLSLRCLLAALTRNEIGQTVAAAVWVSLAIWSKQHAVTVPVAALALALIVRPPWHITLKIGGVFLVLSSPAMIAAIHSNYSTVGQVYEPAIGEIRSELYALPILSDRYERWLLSASTQSELFFQYWRQWFLPDPNRMSVDLRVDFLRPWTHVGAWLRITALAALPLAAVLISLRFRSARLPAFAIVFTSILFLVELAPIRFQEPYVLYRSYLWAIGYCSLLAALICMLPSSRLGVGLVMLILPLLILQAHNRLDTFQSKRTLWEDAAAKLPKLEIAGASRILFNRGGERFRAGETMAAMEDINQAIRLNPGNGHYRISRAMTLLRLDQSEDALADIAAAKQLLPNDGNVLFREFQVLRALGRGEEADVALRFAARYGSLGAKFEIARRNSTNGEVSIQFESP